MNKAQVQEKIDDTKKAMQQMVDQHNVLVGQLNAFIFMLDEMNKMESEVCAAEECPADVVDNAVQEHE